jgi:hypothetical protein
MCTFSVPCGDPNPEVCPSPSGALPQLTATFALDAPKACSDGIDNDGDGKVDYPADPGCSSPSDNDEYNAPPTYNTVLLNKPAKTTRSRRATFGWGAKLGTSYRSNFKSQCKLGKKAWTSCRPGKTYTKLKPGSHTFKVRVAQNGTSRWDKTPASWTWKIKK